MAVITDPDQENIGIGDVSKLCSIPAYTIRYWEKEFKEYVSPQRTTGRQRRYSEDHIRRILHIKKLLWHDRFSIQGAKRLLRQSADGSIASGGKKIPILDTHDLAFFIAKAIGSFIDDSRTEADSAASPDRSH
jgi:DNA-binding transcriptional MerR regulator